MLKMVTTSKPKGKSLVVQPKAKTENINHGTTKEETTTAQPELTVKENLCF